MKNVIIVVMVALCFISCNQEPGTVSGVVTYYFNKNFGYKPDIGARVYLTKSNVDSIADAVIIESYLDIIESIAESENTIQEYQKMEKQYSEDYSSNIANIRKSIEGRRKFLEENTKFSSIAMDKSLYDEFMKRAYIQLFKIEREAEAIQTSVDGTGKYSLEAAPGEFNVIFISVGRTRLNLLERNGRVITRTVKVESIKTANIDIKFEL